MKYMYLHSNSKIAGLYSLIISFKNFSSPYKSMFINYKPAFAAMHGPHSLVRIGPGCADHA